MIQFSSVQSLSHVRLFATPWISAGRPRCLSPTPGVYPNPCPSSRWCHPSILSSVVPFSSWPQSLPASGSFPMSQLFASGGQSIEVSASTSVLPMITQDWSPLRWTGWISLQSKGGLSFCSPWARRVGDNLATEQQHPKCFLRNDNIHTRLQISEGAHRELKFWLKSRSKLQY